MNPPLPGALDDAALFPRRRGRTATGAPRRRSRSLGSGAAAPRSPIPGLHPTPAAAAPPPPPAPHPAAPSAPLAPPGPGDHAPVPHPLVLQYREVLRRARQRESRPDEAQALLDLGRALLHSNAPRPGLACLQDAAVLHQQLDDRERAAQAQELIACAHRQLGELPAARRAALVALTAAEESGNEERACTRLGLLANLYLCDGRPREALPLLQRSVGLAQRLRLDSTLGAQLLLLGQVLGSLGELQESQRCFERAQPLLRRCGQVAEELTARAQLALCTLQGGSVEEGVRLLGECATALRCAAQWPQLFMVADHLAAALFPTQPEKARRWLEEALEIQPLLPSQRGRGLLLLRLGATFYRVGDRRKARLRFEEALPLLDQEGRIDEAIMTRGNLGLVLLDLGTTKAAFAMMEEAVVLAQSTGRVALIAPVQANLGLAYFQAGRRLESRRHLLEAAMGLSGYADPRLAANVRTALSHLGVMPNTALMHGGPEAPDLPDLQDLPDLPGFQDLQDRQASEDHDDPDHPGLLAR